MSLAKHFSNAANYVAQASGYPSVFAMAALTVIVWLASGPAFHYSDTWQLVMNTWTNVATFLMVFLIQNSQNRDSAAIPVKLNELIKASSAHDSFIGIEHLTEEELEAIRARSERAAKSRGPKKSNKTK